MIHRITGVLMLLLTIERGPYIIAVGGVIIDVVVMCIAYIFACFKLDYKIKEIIFDIWKTSLATFFMAIVVMYINVCLTGKSLIAMLILKVLIGMVVYIGMTIILKNNVTKVVVNFLKKHN